MKLFFWLKLFDFINQLLLFWSFLLCKCFEFLNLIRKHFLSLFEFIFNLLYCCVEFILDVDIQVFSNLNSLVISSFKRLVITHYCFFSFNRWFWRSGVHRSCEALLFLFLFFFPSSFHLFQSSLSSSFIKFSHLFKLLICFSMFILCLFSQLFSFSFQSFLFKTLFFFLSSFKFLLL